MTGSVEMSLNRKGENPPIRFKSIKARKSSIAERGPVASSTFLTAGMDDTLVEKKAVTELTHPPSPRPQE